MVWLVETQDATTIQAGRLDFLPYSRIQELRLSNRDPYPLPITQEERENMKAYLAIKVAFSGSDNIQAVSIVLGTDEVNAIEKNQLSGTWYLVEAQEVGTAIVAKKPVSPAEIEASHEHTLNLADED